MQSVLTWSPTFNLPYHIQTEPKHNMDNHLPISEDNILTCRVIWQHCFPDVILQSTLILSSPQPHLFLLIKTISLFTRRLWFDVSTPPWLHYSCSGPQGAPLSPWWPCYLQQWNLRVGLFVLCFNLVPLAKPQHSSQLHNTRWKTLAQ